MKIFLLPCLFLLVSMTSTVWAEEIASPKDHQADISFFALVNGVHLPDSLLELNIKNAVAQGQKDTPALRNNIKQELINRELLSQEAARMGLEEKVDLDAQYLQLKQTLMIQALVQDYLAAHPITEETLKAEYERQTKELGVADGSFTQYRVSQIAVSSQSSAIGLAARIKEGDSFEKLASEFSLDSSTKKEGGQLGWVSLSQLPKEISEVVVLLPKGVNSQPISINGLWIIVKLDDKREAKTKGFKQSKAQLEQGIIQNYLVENVKTLRQRARISQ